jgi:gamma-glutamylputrescine oxidase
MNAMSPTQPHTNAGDGAGGGTVYGGADPKDIQAKLRKNLDKVFPQLSGTEIDHAWSGNFALPFSHVP